MADARSPEARLARMEACYGRLEERINADRESRDVWRAEVLRRLEELNHHAARMDLERDRFLSKEMYESRHYELAQRMESNLREVASRAAEHERDDVRRHDADGKRIHDLEEFKANTQGRLWAIGAIATALATLVQFVLHAIIK